MSVHVSEEDVLELAAGRGGASDRQHAAGCARCAERVGDARAVLAALLSVEVPEPPAGYWAGFRQGVNRRLDAEPRRGPAWRWLVPLAAAAAAVFALAPAGRPVVAPAAPPAAAVATVPPWSALPPIEDDAALPALEAAAGEPVIVALEDGRGLGSFVSGLTDEEAQALAESLQGQRGGEL